MGRWRAGKTGDYDIFSSSVVKAFLVSPVAGVSVSLQLSCCQIKAPGLKIVF